MTGCAEYAANMSVPANQSCTISCADGYYASAGSSPALFSCSDQSVTSFNLACEQKRMCDSE